MMPTDWTPTQITAKIEILENLKMQLEKDYRFKLIEINNQIAHLQNAISNESVMQSNERLTNRLKMFDRCDVI